MAMFIGKGLAHDFAKLFFIRSKNKEFQPFESRSESIRLFINWLYSKNIQIGTCDDAMIYQLSNEYEKEESKFYDFKAKGL